VEVDIGISIHHITETIFDHYTHYTLISGYMCVFMTKYMCVVRISTRYVSVAAGAQDLRAVVWQQEGCWFDPRAPPPPN